VEATQHAHSQLSSHTIADGMKSMSSSAVGCGNGHN
jgi:hypothetical protein